VHEEVIVRHAGLRPTQAQHPYCRASAASTRPPDQGRPLRSRTTDEASPFALRSTRNHPRTAVREVPVACGRGLPGRWRRRSWTGPCQRFARNCAIRNLTSPQDALVHSALTWAVVWVREVLRGVVNHPHIDGMQGVRGSNPLSSTPGQRPSPPSTARGPRCSRSSYAATANAWPIRSSRAAVTRGPASPGSSPGRRDPWGCRRHHITPGPCRAGDVLRSSRGCPPSEERVGPRGHRQK
jgi:hypothetical protein